MESYMTISDLAKRLRLAPQTIRQYRCNNPDKLPPAINATGRPLWRSLDVERWLESRKEGSEKRIKQAPRSVR